jgi:hypothetical protein
MPGIGPLKVRIRATAGAPPRSSVTASAYRKLSAIRCAAWSELARARAPIEAMRLRSAADNRLARARPPRRPKILAMSRAFISIIFA